MTPERWSHIKELFGAAGESHDLTEGGGVYFWSPDNRFIGYLSQGKLKRIEATGGPPQNLSLIHI